MIQQIKKLELEGKCSDAHPLLTKIKALIKAYGCDYPFCRFYQGDNVIISRYYYSCMVYIYGDYDIDEVIEFVLSYQFTFIQCNQKLDMGDNFNYTSGNIYENAADTSKVKMILNDSIKECFNIVGDSFYSSFDKEQYERWYADMSHRVRHGVSKIYNKDGKSSVCLYAYDEDIVILSQIATKKEFRRQGIAKEIVNAVCDEYKGRCIMLYSKNKDSNRFYEKIGFKCVEIWHNYDKVEEEND